MLSGSQFVIGPKCEADWDLQASILRQIVAGPRLQHPEANLDLCYVTDDCMCCVCMYVCVGGWVS